MVVLEVIFLLSKILIDPSVVKFPLITFYMENICFFVSFCFIFTFILQQKGDLWS